MMTRLVDSLERQILDAAALGFVLEDPDSIAVGAANPRLDRVGLVAFDRTRRPEVIYTKKAPPECRWELLGVSGFEVCAVAHARMRQHRRNHLLRPLVLRE